MSATSPVPFRFRRSYAGPIEAVILDWAGTTMDYGCMAPTVAFIEVFKRKGVPISIAEARGPMGAHKRAHIQQITELDAVRERWTKVHGKPPGEADIEAMYVDFVPLQLACLSDYSQLIPGTLEAIAAMRARGCKIGTTSGYTAEMMKINLADAARHGYVPDCTISASDVPAGRPFPHMCLLNVINLGVTTVQSCVKIDDTISGIEEGLNAGMWSVGVAMSGNEIGLPLAELNALPAAERAARRQRAYARMHQAGAHYVVDSIADIMPCLGDIEARLRRGEAP